MLLSHKTTIKLSSDESNIVGHMCYAAYKLWNVCNYERCHYKELSLPAEYPDWYCQKKAHKDDLWYKQLPSQTAQEVCKLLDKSWKSFYALKRSGGIEDPRPPRYKHENIPITYMQNAIVHEPGSDTVRLSLSKQLKVFMSETYGISDNFLYFKNVVFESTDTIKQIRIYPPVGGECNVIVIYEIPDVASLPDNGRYLGIDLGFHNLMTCCNFTTGETFIAGRKYLSLCSRFNKEIARVQSQWSSQQCVRTKHPKGSKHISKLYVQKNNAISDYLHKVTRSIVSYCMENDIHTVVIGDLKGIRRGKNFGHVTNQKLHSLPYEKLYTMLGYKLALEGITLIRQNEAYSSQVSPMAESVDKINARKSNRIHRGLYRDGGFSWNADCIGAYNIVRLYLAGQGIDTCLNPALIRPPYVLKVAV